LLPTGQHILIAMNKAIVQQAGTTESETVFVIDPDESVHDALATLLGSSGYEVECFATAESFIESDVLARKGKGFLLVEASLPGIGCIALIRLARNLGSHLATILLTSTSDHAVAEQAIRAGAIAVLEKPLLRGPPLRQLRSLSRQFNQPGL
jgi:FixJ family two-component response regulator